MSTEDQPTQIPVDAPRPAPASEDSSTGSSPSEDRQSAADERPELLVAGAFAGAFVFAQVLKRLGGGDA